jgi:V/A-type H+-transporting ATPase subunit I
LVLAAFTPNIHAMRLNFLEFFGSFYEAGKEEYRPFHKTGGEKSA